MRGAALAGLTLAACAPRALPEGMPAVATATYRCADGRLLAVRFDNRADVAVVTFGERRVRLRGQRPASGIWYAGEGYELRGKGDGATFSAPDAPATDCKARG